MHDSLTFWQLNQVRRRNLKTTLGGRSANTSSWKRLRLLMALSSHQTDPNYVVLPKLLQREHDVVAAGTGVSTFGLSPWRRSSRHFILTISANESISFPILSKCLVQTEVLAVKSVGRVAKISETAQVSAAVQIAQCTNSSRRTLTCPFSLLVRMKYILMCHT